MKKTIEDLTISKTFYHRDKDIYGNRTKEPYQKDVKREIQLITGWTRFAHYFLDAIIIGVISFGVSLLFGEVLRSTNSTSIRLGGYYYNFIPTIDNIIITVGYYFICEKTMQRTIGKFATNSVVINQYADAPDSGSLLGRSFSRLVPFEAFSCLGDRGWHDKWSKTYVVSTQERDKLRRLLNEQKGVFISESEDILD